jgi:hypothetical protein
MVTKAKYRRLSPVGRGALLHTLILAGFQNPEAAWPDPEELRDALRLEGFPDGAYDELVALHWIEYEDGAAVLHDWDQHQLAATREAQREWERARKRKWRRSKKVSPNPPSKKQDITPPPQHNSPGHGMDMSGTGNGDGGGRQNDLEQVRALYVGLYHRVPTQGATSYFASLLDGASVDRICKALASEHSRNPDPKTLISRMQKGLRLGDQLARSSSDRLPHEPSEMTS